MSNGRSVPPAAWRGAGSCPRFAPDIGRHRPTESKQQQIKRFRRALSPNDAPHGSAVPSLRDYGALLDHRGLDLWMRAFCGNPILSMVAVRASLSRIRRRTCLRLAPVVPSFLVGGGGASMVHIVGICAALFLLAVGFVALTQV